MKRPRSYSVIILIVSTLTLTLSLLNGCSRKDNIIVPEAVSNGSGISISLSRSAAQSDSESTIEAILQVRGTGARIEKVIYTITGQISLTDTLVYWPAMTEVSETINISKSIGVNPDGSALVSIIAIGEDGIISTFEHIFYPVDVQAPNISISYDNSHGYAPNDTVMVHVTASDNTALYYIALSTAGAFAWNDTVCFSMPYPAAIDTVIPVPIPLTTYLNFEFWITAEAVDANFNSSSASPDESIQIVFKTGPLVEIHPVGGSKWVNRGDSLRFWVVGYNSTPLKSLGYWLRYGWGQIGYAIEYRDSLINDFGCIDSAYFAFRVPDTVYCENDIYVKPFAYDYLRHYTTVNDYFMVEGRIRFSKATAFKALHAENSYQGLLVDDRRNLVYLGTDYGRCINVYSQISRQFLDPIDIPLRASGLCLTSDTNAIIVLHLIDYRVSIVDISGPAPHADTTIELPGLPYSIAALSDGTALIRLLHMEDPPQILRLNLTDFSTDIVDLGTAVPRGVTVSGNSEYAVISAYDSNAKKGVLFMYQSGVGIISSRTLDWTPYNGVANGDGSRFAFAGWDMDTKVGIFNADLSIIGSISTWLYHGSIGPAVYSRNARDLYLSYHDFIGLYETEPGSIEGIYHMSSYPDSQQTMAYFATNATDDRLFMICHNGGLADYFFYDIPVDPR